MAVRSGWQHLQFPPIDALRRQGHSRLGIVRHVATRPFDDFIRHLSPDLGFHRRAALQRPVHRTLIGDLRQPLPLLVRQVAGKTQTPA